MVPTVLHLSTYDTRGGAARAAYALHRTMVDGGVDSTLRVAMKTVDDSSVHSSPDLRFRIANELEHRLCGLQRSPLITWRSPAYLGCLSAHEINASNADIVNIHWATDGFMSIREIGRIQKPVVWSIYDMWPFCGTEHYGTDTPHARWRTGYTRENRPPAEGGIDLDRRTWERKTKWWIQARHVVAASSWMQQAVEASALMGTWPNHRIPHVIDCDTFAPMNMDDARAQLGLPQGVPLILFLASAGINDDRKGWDLLDEALHNVRRDVPDVEVVVVGPIEERYSASSGVRIHWRGILQGNEALSLHYNAANVTAVPSREDNMPLTAMESQSCGRAVVAFAIGGLPDIVADGETGRLAAAGDISALAKGLTDALQDSQTSGSFASAARERALATWSREVVLAKYLAVYEQAMS